MALRIRRGTEEQRTGRTFELGELVYTTNAQQLWVGDGSTAGGVPVVGSNVAGYGLIYNNISRKLEVSGLTTDDVTQGTNNKYFSTELAVDAVGAALVAGNSTNVGITFTYSQTQDDAGRINATVAMDGIGITNLVEDTSPQLGGDLDLNSNDITGTGNIDITGSLKADGGVNDNLNLNTNDLTNVGDLKFSATGNIYASDSGFGLKIYAKTGNSLWAGYYDGTAAAPTAIAPGNPVGGISIMGYNGTEYAFGGALFAIWDATADTTGTAHPASTVGIAAGTNGNDPVSATLNKDGVFTAPIFKATGYETGSEPASPEEGWIIFDSTTKKFKGFNGTVWSDLN